MFVSIDSVLRVGNEIKAAPRGLEWPGLIFLLDNVALQDGVLFAFTAYFRAIKKVHLQIWRPVNESTDEYRLVGDWPTVPAVVDGRENVSYILITGPIGGRPGVCC